MPTRLPSSTPSRRSTSSSPVENPVDNYSTTPDRRIGSNVTTPETHHQRPRIPQSEPAMSRVRNQPALSRFLTPTPTQRYEDRRRVSDPLHFQQTNNNNINPRSTARPRIASAPNVQPTALRTQQDEMPSRSDDNQPSNETPSFSAIKADVKLCKFLRKPITDGEAKGFLYVLKPKDIAHQNRGVKIGYTTNEDIWTRFAQHEKACGFTPEILHVSKMRLEYCKKTEGLVHRDLADLRNCWKCTSSPCKTNTHTEWFAVDEALAVETVKKWESFMNTQRPYDSHSKGLSGLWTYLLDHRLLSSPLSDDNDHDARRARWMYIISPPTLFDRLRRILHCQLWHWIWRDLLTAWFFIQPYIAMFRWEIVALVFAFVVSRDTSIAILASGGACWKLKFTLPEKSRSRRT